MEATLTTTIDGKKITFTGTAEEAWQFLHELKTGGKLDTNVWYNSSSKGWDS